ncbi:MAG: tol-pal system-associated acyl-CoA thioesterase [Micavibrio sp.]|nr:tol-pal system-associated acyl-CoA thioesterase [Micavibrio sp.]|tara:strand:+ start:839 stop:1237 length:399 start_codon:yes stop_codon:yes gene_type:complete
MTKSHDLPIRVYYEDTDAGGVMYHASHIRFCERGRTEFLRELGFQNSGLFKKHGLLFVVRHLSADYRMPAFLDDMLSLTTYVLSTKNTSFVMRQTLKRDKNTLFEMDVVIACISKEGKPVKIPLEILSLLKD